MKSIIIIFAAMMMIICTPAFFVFVDDVLTDNVTVSYSTVITPAVQYSANVTLPKSLFNDNIANVETVTSNLSADSPTAFTYYSGSKTLEISGLIEDTIRTLSVDILYNTENLDTGFTIFWTTIRWLWVLVILALIGGSIYAFFD